MFDGSIANPLALVLLALSLVAALPLGVIAVRGSRQPLTGPLARPLAAFAIIALAVLWLVLAPFNVANRALGEPMIWLFGREAQDTGLVEYATVLLFAAAAGLCAVLATRGAALGRLIYAVGAVAAFLIAGEEMSWGQWLFHWSTPADLYAGNLQNETNLHNFLPPVFWETVYAIAGWGIIATALVMRFARPRFRFGLLAVLRDSRFAAPLALGAGVLMQHHFFQEISEVALGAAGVYALGWIAARELRAPRSSLAPA